MQQKGVINHIGIIMDGNRRWARAKNLASREGHQAGYEKLKEVVSWCEEEGIQTLIAYAFSTENWRRTKTEIDFLMKLLDRAVSDFIKQQREQAPPERRIIFIGDRRDFSEKIQDQMRAIEEQTRDNKGFTLVLALSYGGRAEIVRAVNTVLMKAAAGEIDNTVDQERFASFLYTRDIPDPDLIIRTGGQKRLSNFLLWQSAYTELAFTDTYWPAFSRKEFNAILKEASTRDRGFGA